MLVARKREIAMNKVLTKNDEGLPVSLDQLPPIAKNLHWIARRKKSVV